jgi:tetratricopeptide (TPR) repeat protein
MSWFAGEDHSHTLEEDLRRFVDNSPIIEGAIESLFEAFDKLSPADMMFHSVFCIEAVRASLCAANKLPNPNARNWVWLFFEHELSLQDKKHSLPQQIKALIISEERARATITFQDATEEIAQRINKLLTSQQEMAWKMEHVNKIRAIASKAGHANIVEDVVERLQLTNVNVEELADLLISQLRNPPANLDLDALVYNTQVFAKPLVQHGRVDDIERIADSMIEVLKEANESRAGIEAWLGSQLKEMRAPLRFLERVGAEPRPWEFDLPAPLRASLGNERSNALRLLGRSKEALEQINQTLTILGDNAEPDMLRVAQQNRAILLRETGAPDMAIEILEHLIDESDPPKQMPLLESLAATYAVVGRSEDALRCLDRAINLAGLARPERVLALQAMRAQLAVVASATLEPPQVLLSADIDLRKSPVAAIAEGTAWVNFLANDGQLPTGAEERLNQLFDTLPDLIADAETRSDASVHIGALTLLGFMLEQLGKQSEAEIVWGEIVHVALKKYDQPPIPIALLKLAYFAYKRGDVDAGHTFLTTVPQALSDDLGGIQDLKPTVSAPILLREALNELMSTMLFVPEAKATWKDIRIVSELRRDIFTRSRLLRQQSWESSAAGLTEGLTDEVIGRLAPDSGHLAVFECINDDKYTAFCITCIDANGTVSSKWLERPKPDIDLSRLAIKMQTRLNNWTLNRPGDPFDLQEWRSFETWIVKQLERYLGPGDHLIFIEDKDYLGIPWHVAVTPHWTSSYVASWTNLLMLQSQQADQRETMGIILVPRFSDPPEVAGALREFAHQMQVIGASAGLRCIMVQERECDRNAFLQIMSNTDIAFLLCHGFIDPADGEIAIMLAYDHLLPLGTPVASSTPIGRLHRVSWRECQELRSAPRLVFSAACRSGIIQIGGIGEQLGLFSALRNVGTKTLVAPRWDIVAAQVLPILKEVFANYIHGIPLAQALYNACRNATVAKCPRWVAWSLTIEGDWR